MKKLKTIFWIILLVLLSAPAGFITIFTEKPLTPRSEYLMILIIGMLATIIFIGAMSLIPYFILKKQKSEYAFTRTLQFYSFFVFAMLAVGVYKLPDAVQERDREEFVSYYEPQFNKIIKEKINSELDTTKIDLVKSDEIQFCMFSNFRYNSELTDKVRGAANRKQFILNDPEMKAMFENCVGLYAEKE